MPRLWAVFDLDGTLSNCEHRVALARAKQWDAFHQACVDDPPHLAEVMIALAWAASGGRVAYNTGRTEPYRSQTRVWLQQQGLPQGLLFMRAEGDRRPSTVAKREQLQQLEADFLAKGDQIAFIMEDQDKLVALWRELGYTCLQPRPGAF
jgi:phosphoglycolate phosphatase-like HAD superfamily hydrolase